ncbi:diheme cytochrome c [Acidovorax soli]|uniref:diheme cytochrome c n=1 Tax=Acidovorax TaxID=12916 RepID=UPI0026EA1615|nr:diheme cytochrome c [Acidovorax soli]MCM2347586.1 diheme cytochrome c [Acidovorax soli]
MNRTAFTMARTTPLVRTARRSATLLALACALPAAWADSREMPASAMLPAYRQECAACHMAYPPGMLPASAWIRMMKGLDQHYGTNASLDPAMVGQISTWLQAHAGTTKRAREAPPQDRITQSAWFERKHREVKPAVWKRTAVGSRAHCMACHTRADQGDFDDDRVRIPKRELP